MKILVALAALCVAGVACARPVIVKETGRINFPNISGYRFSGPAAVDGDDAIVLGYRDEIDDQGYSNTFNGAFLFHRNGTTWLYVRKLAEGFDTGADDTHGHVAIAMKGGIAALALLPLFIFERQPNGDWLQAQISGGSSDTPADDIEIDNGRIFWGANSFGGTIFERNAAGVWTATAALNGDYSGDNDNGSGDAIEISGSWAAVLSPYNIDEQPAPAITTFFNNGPGSWAQVQRLVPLAGHTFGDLALRGEDMFVGDSLQFGLAQYSLDGNQQWYPRAQLRTPGDFMSALTGFSSAGHVTKANEYIFHHASDYDRQGSVVRVFQAPDVFSSPLHVATLIDSRGGNLGEPQVSGRRVIALGTGGALIFDLPATFIGKSLLQDSFETGNGGGWTQLAGSQWSIAQSGETRVFRQASTVGDAGASFDAANWANQSIQADVKPTAFNGADRWVGLATRRSDASNYYYVTLRSSGIVALKRNKNGAFANIASASFPVTLNRMYRLRLESFGARHRVYIDGVPVLDVIDDQLIAGHPALLTYRAAADFDNVLVSPSPTATIFAADSGPNFSPPEAGAQPAPWTYSGTGQWYWIYDAPANLVFRQTSNTGNARVAIDPGINMVLDQIVEARVRIRSFGAGTDEKWVGLMAQYTEPSNFLYMSLRSSNLLTLRRVESGSIRQLGTVVMPVALNTWYQLRLDAVGNRVRAFVNGKLMIEVVEPQAWAGNGGLVTYKAAADFDDFREIQP